MLFMLRVSQRVWSNDELHPFNVGKMFAYIFLCFIYLISKVFWHYLNWINPARSKQKKIMITNTHMPQGKPQVWLAIIFEVIKCLGFFLSLKLEGNIWTMRKFVENDISSIKILLSQKYIFFIFPYK